MRVMTTTEAKTRMCPMKMVGLASSSADRCRADECMAWRWHLNGVHVLVTTPTDRRLRLPSAAIAHQDPSETVWKYRTPPRPDIGYCGIAITPTIGESGVWHRQATEDDLWPKDLPQPPTATEEPF